MVRLGGCKAGVIRHGIKKLIHPEHTDNAIEGPGPHIAQDLCGTGRGNLAEAKSNPDLHSVVT